MGNPNDPQKLAELTLATKACYDFSLAYGTPFISGKDSLYNEYLYEGKNIAIPGTLLISSVGVMPDVSKRITMYAKKEGNLIYLVGKTYDELGASHYYLLHNEIGKNIPQVRPEESKPSYDVLAKIASSQSGDRTILAMHDLSEGGLAVALAEMSFSGMIGMHIDLENVLCEDNLKNDVNRILFSESNSRILVEVAKEKKEEFEKIMQGINFSLIGKLKGSSLVINNESEKIVDEDLRELKKSWKETLNW